MSFLSIGQTTTFEDVLGTYTPTLSPLQVFVNQAGSATATISISFSFGGGERYTETPSLSDEVAIAATQTAYALLPTFDCADCFKGDLSALITPSPTPFAWECDRVASEGDPCYQAYVEYGGDAAATLYWSRRTQTPMPTAVPTERVFATWTPSTVPTLGGDPIRTQVAIEIMRRTQEAPLTATYEALGR